MTPELLPFDRRLDTLKTRELEIVLCVAAGDTDRQIARQLEVSVSTIRRGVRAAAAALGLGGRRALATEFGEGQAREGA